MLASPYRCDLLFESGDMMEAVKQYIISVISASIVCAVLKALLGKSETLKMLDILCGIFLLFTFLRPVKDVHLIDLVAGIQWDDSIVQEAVCRGEEFTKNEMADIISQEIASYIEEKADALGVDVQIEVRLSDEAIPAPVGIDLKGSVSPYVRNQLEAYISQNLGLKGEDVQWIGQH